MADTATSPRFRPHPSSARPATVSAAAASTARPTNTRTSSVGQPGASSAHYSNAHPLATPLVQPASVGVRNGQVSSYFNYPAAPSPELGRHKRATPSSAVRSTAAPSPSIFPLDQNADYASFRRQSDEKAFSLGGLGHDFTASTPSRNIPGALSQVRTRTGTGSSMSRELTGTEIKAQALDPSSNELSRSPKRLPSPGSVVLPEEARRASPASFSYRDFDSRRRDPSLDCKPRFALPLDGLPKHDVKLHAQSLPHNSTPGADLFVTPQHLANLLESSLGGVLLLDLRVATQYAKAHISGALNLCIPTTLLKRPSFNVQKLGDTFKDEQQRRKFEAWRSCRYIVVYDGSSSASKDATICLNTTNKFTVEGYDGHLYIVKGGFTDFSRLFPEHVESNIVSFASSSSSPGVESDGPEVAPVAGGCPMPSTEQPVNPFFGNIRQNMDLIGGVGQIALNHPAKGSRLSERDFPRWLQAAADLKDEGERVSRAFERIERREKKRMEDALSTKVMWDNQADAHDAPVRIAGLEKGNKNRYNNIWPFEHTRVKLQGVPMHGCDYFNASYVHSSWSNKRYISTQAPIPATFNDFWNVVWQQDIRVIVMLTAEKEGAQVKAHNYWETGQYGPLRLDFNSEKRATIDPERIQRHHDKRRAALLKRSSTSASSGSLLSLVDTPQDSRPPTEQPPHIIVRRFTLSHEKHPWEPMREITQLHYTAWPDFGAPAHPKHLLGLVEQADAVARAVDRATYSSTEPVPPNPRPVLVHCSAGCGRTGAFCTVDSVVDMLKRQRAARLASKLTRPKHQRKRSSRSSNSMDIDSTPSKPTVPSDEISDLEKGVDGLWVQRDDTDLVAHAVEDFRSQRLSMVQSLRQFVLCYEAVMEWLVGERLKADEEGEESKKASEAC